MELYNRNNLMRIEFFQIEAREVVVISIMQKPETSLPRQISMYYN